MSRKRAETLAWTHWNYVGKVLEHAGKPFDEGVKQAYRHGFVYGYTESETWNIKAELRTAEEVFHFNSACEHGAKHKKQDKRGDV